MYENSYQYMRGNISEIIRLNDLDLLRYVAKKHTNELLEYHRINDLVSTAMRYHNIRIERYLRDKLRLTCHNEDMAQSNVRHNRRANYFFTRLR